MRFRKTVLDTLLRRARQEQEMAEELRFHIDHRAEHLERLGMGSEEARRQARLEFGGLEGYKERCREALGRRLADELIADTRYVCRTLWRMPGFTAIAVLSLALSIGVNLTCFASLYAMVLNPFGYPDVQRISEVFEVRAGSTSRELTAPGNYLEWQQRNRSFESLAAYREWDANVARVGQPDHVSGAMATAELFDTLAVKPEKGRTFTATECRPGHDAVAVIGNGFWRTRLAAAADVLGKRIALNGRTYTVIGVMPKEFNLPLAAELWTPLAFSETERDDRQRQSLTVIGKLRDGVTQAQAVADLNRVAAQLAAEYPQTNKSQRVLVTSLTEAMTAENGAFLTVLMCAALFVLLLGSINVGSLQMARVVSRQKEIGLRRALGANGWRIGRQLITENMTIALAGGAAGLGLATWHLSIIRASIPAQIYQVATGLKNLRVNGEVALYGLALSIGAGMLCSLPAVIEAVRGGGSTRDLNEILKEGGRSSRSSFARRRLRAVLVAGEIALAFVLLVGAGLMVTTVRKMATLDLGYDPANLLTGQMALSGDEYQKPGQAAAFYQRVLQALERRPEVDASAVVSDSGPVDAFAIEGREHAPADELRPGLHAASSQYLRAMRLRLLAGRWLADSDGALAGKVAVISETVARHYWPHTDPLGRRVRLGAGEAPWLTIIGVTGDIHNWFLGQPEPAVYVSYRQFPSAAMEFAVRGRNDSRSLAGTLRLAAKAADAEQPVFGLHTREEELHTETTGIRNAASLMGTYAAIALVLSATGIYSITSFFVTQRKPDLAVRMSLGASRGSILRMVLAQACRLAGWGLAVGVPAAALLTLAMSRILYGLVRVEPGIFVLFVLVLGGCATVAGIVPAYRATLLDPLVILRQE